ncbi:MAG: biotin carboxylase N-terminal domain-containing protein [Streptosporangiaceae bacterium]
MTTPGSIRKLLIANRGEIASRIIRTARAMDIATVAVFSDPDAGLPYVPEADEAVRLPGSAPAETYLRGGALIAAAATTGADAVHPGYGFLSENAGFARACAAAGLTFVGPPPEAIEAMGSKTAAKELMAAAGVPVLPGAVFDDGAEPDPAELRKAAEDIGFPVLIKAAYGGGGRGMRIVAGPDEIAGAVASARREAASAFGNGTVFLERFVESPRHIEVQILGDQAGTVVHLFERECSIQRRYQKIIEEAPSPAVSGELRAELCRAAVAAGQAIGYVGAGTVEFVLDSSGRFYFLEVNTRLQVEHPVTELITGLDLVRLQLEIAAGQPLPPEVTGAGFTGHAIEARLYAEDVPAGYLPASGDLHTFEIDLSNGLRVDAGFASGTRVSTFYDSMLAKVIGYGPTRDAARRTLAGALSRARLHGVVTNRDLLVGILREPEFAAGAIDTGYLARHQPGELCPPDAAAGLVHLLAVALAGQAWRREEAPVLGTLPSGWRNNPSAPQRASYEMDGRLAEVSYRFGRDGLQAEVDGAGLGDVVLHGTWPTPGAATAQGAVARGNGARGGVARGGVARGGAGRGGVARGGVASPPAAQELRRMLVDLEIGGVRRAIQVTQAGRAFYVDSALGHSVVTETDRFPDPAAAAHAGSLLAPMPGTVVRVEAAVGDRVEAGALILAIEAMKMEHAIHAPAPGIVTELPITVGAQVDSGSVLAVLEEEPRD